MAGKTSRKSVQDVEEVGEGRKSVKVAKKAGVKRVAAVIDAFQRFDLAAQV